MPTYIYKRKDGTKFEIEQRITAPALKTCPTTNQAVTRLISPGAGLVFKGSGFYLTDYARAGSKDPEKESAGGPSSESDQSGKKSRDRSESSDSTSKSSDGRNNTAVSGSKNSD